MCGTPRPGIQQVVEATQLESPNKTTHESPSRILEPQLQALLGKLPRNAIEMLVDEFGLDEDEVLEMVTDEHIDQACARMQELKLPELKIMLFAKKLKQAAERFRDASL